MTRLFWRRLVTALFVSSFLFFLSCATLQVSRATPSAQSDTPAGKDRSQWRKLHRGMVKDDVRKLLGEPDRISVSRFSESWYYSGGNTNFSGGSVTFDGKGRVDFWSEP